MSRLPALNESASRWVTSPLLSWVFASLATRAPPLEATSRPPTTAGPPLISSVNEPVAPGASEAGPVIATVGAVPPEWQLVQIDPDLPE